MNPLVQLIRNIVFHGLEKYGRYYSSYRGFVINNEDPEGMNRLQLKVPNVYGNNINPYWAWPKTFSGPNYGCQNIPEKKEMVWVEFEHGDVRKPIWNYGHFGQPGKKHDIPEALRNIKNRWFKTPKGHLIEFDDDKDEIRLTHSDSLATLVIRKDNQFILNGGVNNGMVMVTELTAQLNEIETRLNAHVAKYNIHTHTGNLGAPTTPPLASDTDTVDLTQQGEIENPQVTH